MKQVNIPEGVSGDWRIDKFVVDEKEAKRFNVIGAFSFSGGYIYPGTYTRLSYKGSVVMSDTPSEMRDHSHFVYKAKGTVLINGLGLGMVLVNVLERQSVEHVIVNELSEDVINLVAPYYTDPRVIINHADAFTWKPDNGMKFDAIWHDIWGDKCEDNIPEMQKLHRRYARWKVKEGYQGSWGHTELIYRRDREKRYSYF